MEAWVVWCLLVALPLKLFKKINFRVQEISESFYKKHFKNGFAHKNRRLTTQLNS
jgi:hypothetical protein